MSRANGLLWRGFTLIELMIAIAIVGLLAILAVPSFRNMIIDERLRSISSQTVTDFQLARSEAVSRNAFIRLTANSDADKTCYTIYTFATNDTRCDCRVSPACTAVGSSEVRTLQVQRSLGVLLATPDGQPTSFDFDPATGGIRAIPTDRGSPALDSFQMRVIAESGRSLRTIVGRSGRPTVCSSGGVVTGVPAC